MSTIVQKYLYRLYLSILCSVSTFLIDFMFEPAKDFLLCMGSDIWIWYPKTETCMSMFCLDILTTTQYLNGVLLKSIDTSWIWSQICTLSESRINFEIHTANSINIRLKSYTLPRKLEISL
jgi:hypothetical protein